jgi:hypothetical protein
MTRTIPRRVARSILKRGWNTSSPSLLLRFAAAMCSCFGCVRAQYQLTVSKSVPFNPRFIGWRHNSCRWFGGNTEQYTPNNTDHATAEYPMVLLHFKFV